MELSEKDRALIAALEGGLPLSARPYATLARVCGQTEAEVIGRIGRLSAAGAIQRFGVIVRHRELGYRANAMVVWDVPDDEVRAAGERLAALSFVTLCYRRPRRPPLWPYNLFSMIHGRDRLAVLKLVRCAAAEAGLEAAAREALFSRRCFKQRGARYAAVSTEPLRGEMPWMQQTGV